MRLLQITLYVHYLCWLYQSNIRCQKNKSLQLGDVSKLAGQRTADNFRGASESATYRIADAFAYLIPLELL